MEVYEENFITVIKTETGYLKLGWIFNSGFLKGESEYLIGTNEIIKNKNNPLIYLKKVKWAIYSGKTGEKLTQDFDWISPLGLVKGQSAYFRATKDGKEALFTLEGQITQWFDKIRDRGALTGESNYFWGKKNGHYALYDINTGEKLTDDFKSSVIAGALIGKSDYIVGSYGEEIFFILDLKTGEKVSPDFDEGKLIEILKHGDLGRAVREFYKI
ncbi:hypothetical protein [Persephonella sp.]